MKLNKINPFQQYQKCLSILINKSQKNFPGSNYDNIPSIMNITDGLFHLKYIMLCTMYYVRPSGVDVVDFNAQP